jgi:hypothetical protein
VGGERVAGSFGGGFHAALAFLPSGGADLSQLFVELEYINHSEHFIHVASERKVVHYLTLDDALLVDEKRSPHGHHLRMLRRKVQTKALDERGKLTCLGNGWPQQ